MIGQQTGQTARLAQASLNTTEIINDYRLALESRYASVIGRREVLSGKAKFGIFGDGKEVAQLAMAKSFQKGDFRAGYYRDQTLMLALNVITLESFFAQLYAHADVKAEPAMGGRSMNAHFATRSLAADGKWRNLMEMVNVSADISPTGSQMPRLVGLAYASRLYRELEELRHLTQFSHGGNEVVFGTIGNASCAEGMFWEAINAIGVLKAPLVLSIWDDGYGISVTNEFQHTKGDIGPLLEGFRREPGGDSGYDIYTVAGWDYPGLVDVYMQAATIARSEHIPAIVHVVELTQPQGHSTSGSHERYKPAERLAWEAEFDAIRKMGAWMVAEGIAPPEMLEKIANEARQKVEAVRIKAWKAYQEPIRREIGELVSIIDRMATMSGRPQALVQARDALTRLQAPERKDVMRTVRNVFVIAKDEPSAARRSLVAWKATQERLNAERYNSHLYNETGDSALNVKEWLPHLPRTLQW